MAEVTRLAKEIKVGDRIVRSTAAYRQQIATVLAVVQSAQIVKKPVLIVTVQIEGGDQTHLQYNPHSPVHIDLAMPPKEDS